MNNEILLCWDATKNGLKTLSRVLDNLIEKKKIHITKVLYLYCEYICECCDERSEETMTVKDRIEFLNNISSYINDCSGERVREVREYNLESTMPQSEIDKFHNLRPEEQKLYYMDDIFYFHKSNKIEYIPISIPKDYITSETANSYNSIQRMVEEYLIQKVVRYNPSVLHISVSSGTQAMRTTWITLHSQSFFNAYFGDTVRLWAFSDEAIKKNIPSNPLKEIIIKQNPYISKIQNIKYKEGDSNRIDLDIDGEIKKTATINAPILLLGERGTGKSYIINEIYNTKIEAGIIKEGAKMIVEVCGALDGSLIDDRLFGHWKGAFTGADSDKEGVFGSCKGGLLFLDEIQDIPKSTQRKILRAINEGKISRLGHAANEKDQEEEVKITLICASNRTLNELQEGDRLDPDFLDRIARFICIMKPLRELNENKLREIWKVRWQASREEGLLLPDVPDDFSIVKETLAESHMYGNIRDINQLIAYIARDVYEGTTEITQNKKEQKYEEVLKRWKEDYNAKYNSSTLADKKNLKAQPSKELLEEQGWDGMSRLFKQWLSGFAKDIYGSDKAAAVRLKTTDRTLRDARKN